MSFSALIIADSISPNGHRLTTFQVTYPRIVHAEMMTHRMFSRNSASTRAIALIAQLRNLLANPFIPEKFGINMSGMQATSNLEGFKHDEAVQVWLAGRDRALTTFLELILGKKVMAKLFQYSPMFEYVSGDRISEKLDEIIALIPDTKVPFDPTATSVLNVHKQLAGRGLEAYMWHTIVLTATEFHNFYALRDHKDAQGEIATIARLMREAYEASKPTRLEYGEWHLPYVDAGEFADTSDAIKASVARTAAVSYNRQGVKDAEAQLKLYERLLAGGHMSPFEHQATPISDDEWRLRKRMKEELVQQRGSYALDALQVEQIEQSLEFSGNFRGWISHRKMIRGEDNFATLQSD